jgi:hypothetical protein
MRTEAMTDKEIEQLWKVDICDRAAADCAIAEANPDEYDGTAWDEEVWQSIWVGFVVAHGRPELANYRDYMRIGFPHEIATGLTED